LGAIKDTSIQKLHKIMLKKQFDLY